MDGESYPPLTKSMPDHCWKDAGDKSLSSSCMMIWAMRAFNDLAEDEILDLNFSTRKGERGSINRSKMGSLISQSCTFVGKKIAIAHRALSISLVAIFDMQIGLFKTH